MEIRKFWKKAMLAAFASMWAGCDDGSSSSSEFVPEYGAPCYEDNGCEVMPEYGVPYNPEEELTDSSEVVVDSSAVDSLDSPEMNEFDAPIAVYGPPCYFDGSCRED